MKLLPLALFACAILVSVAAFAADRTFTAADRNGDGVLDMAEVRTVLPEATPEGFETADTDDDGTLTEAEFLAAISYGVLPNG